MKEQCSKFFCWELAVGYIERKFVTYERYYVCEKHGQKDMEKWKKEHWQGSDWYTQKFIKSNLND